MYQTTPKYREYNWCHLVLLSSLVANTLHPITSAVKNYKNHTEHLNIQQCDESYLKWQKPLLRKNLFEEYVFTIFTRSTFFSTIFFISAEVWHKKKRRKRDLWPMLQPTTRGQIRCFGFNFGELSCCFYFYYSLLLWKKNQVELAY